MESSTKIDIYELVGVSTVLWGWGGWGRGRQSIQSDRETRISYLARLALNGVKIQAVLKDGTLVLHGAGNYGHLA